MSDDHSKRIAIWEEVREWAQSRWDAEVKNRPTVNVNYRALDCSWRQVMRKCDAEISALRCETPIKAASTFFDAIDGETMPWEAPPPSPPARKDGP